jgi:hypothetical protein
MTSGEKRRRAAKQREKRAARAERTRIKQRLGIPNALLAPSARFGEISMSDVLADLAEPLLAGFTTRDLRLAEHVLQLASLVWNLVVDGQRARPDPSREDLQLLADDVIAEATAICGSDDEMVEAIQYLVDRKLADFPEVTRKFLRVEVKPQIGRPGMHIDTMTTLDDPHAELR